MLVALSVPRIQLPREVLTEAVVAVLHQLISRGYTVMGMATGRRRYRIGAARPGRRDDGVDFAHTAMLVADPILTTREVRRQASSVLPGVRVRCLLFWRYLLVWQKPLVGPVGAIDGRW